MKVVDEAVVHPEPTTVAERVTVGLLDRRAGGSPDVRKDDSGTDVARELSQVAVVPGRFGAVEDGRCTLRPVPSDSEPVPIRPLRSQLRVEALDDQRMLRPIEQFLEQNRGARIRKPATHSSCIQTSVSLPRLPPEGMNIRRTVGPAAGWAAAAANSTDDGRRDEARTPTRPSRGPRYEAARGGCRDRHGVDRDHGRGGNTDDGRRP